MNDGSIQYGSDVLVLNGINYIADDIQVQRPSKEINSTNQIDEPRGSVNYEDFHRGTATLQLADASTAPPAKGTEFTVTWDANYGSETFFIYDYGQPMTKDGERKIPVTFKKKYN